ncbi:MAG: hypothetical protein QOE23_509, partial [Pseudonocardiales bacterium]|nr:hypothetical protein [Pseudonocardiales bacterium]
EPTGARQCIHQLVRQQADRTPDAVAVSFGTATLTYRELVERAERLARQLRTAGTTAEEVVAVVAERSPELIVRLLGVLCASAAYLALEPDLPAARRDQLLAAAGCRTVLGAPADLVLPAGVRTLDDSAPDEPVPDEPAPDEPALDEPGGRASDVPEQLAYLSFTSGSTGEPKAVCVPHAAVARLVIAPDWCDFGPSDVFLQLAPVAFDASTLEIWAPLCNGGRLAIMAPGPLDLAELAATIAEQRVSVLWLTAGLFSRFVDRHPEAFAGVRQVISGGDVVSPAHVRRLLEAWPGLRFTNGYGPTENTTFTSCWSTTEPPAGPDPIPIGRPISGTRVRLLDEDLQPVPPGTPGQLCAAGAGLARGYLGRPAATAERFRPDPAGPPGARMYLTGDLARLDDEQNLHFLGRADRQLKLRGYRIEPAEIEAAMLAVPGVSQALVVAEPEPAGSGRRLAGYLTVGTGQPEAGQGAAEISAAVRHRLAERLPGYLVPPVVTVLSEFPLTSNGKIDLEQLGRPPEPPAAAAPQPDAAAQPAGTGAELESWLSQLWASKLGLDQVGPDEDFFELGGHSLVAAELLDAVQRRYSVFIPGRALYLNPTVRELAVEVAAELGRTAAGTDPEGGAGR